MGAETGVAEVAVEQKGSQHITPGGGEDRADLDLARFFSPRSIAVIGASTNPDSISGRPLQFLRQHRYAGAVYPVNPKYEEVAGYRCYPDIESVPGPVDVAMIAVSARLVPGIVEACHRKGVRFVIIFSAGFAEVGGDGETAQAELQRIVAAGGPRIVGPNCIGSLNVAEAIPMGFAFPLGAPSFKVGPIGFAGQSGAFTYATFSVAQELGLGYRYVANTGNEADLDCIHFLSWMVEQPETTTLATYLEGVRDAERLLALGRRAAELGKPIIALKAGRSAVGRAAVASHTAAMTGSAEAFAAVGRQMGFTLVDDADELMDALMIFSRAKRPRGNRVAVLSTSGASGILMADHCTARGLELPQLPEETRRRIAEAVPAFGSPRNPVDITAAVMDDPTMLRRVLEILADCPEIDIIVAMFSTLTGEVARRVCLDTAEVASRCSKPIVINVLGSDELAAAGLEVLRNSDVAYFRAPGRVARALKWLVDHARFVEDFQRRRPGWLERLEGPGGEDPLEATGLEPGGEGEAWLRRLEEEGPSEGLSKALVAACGIPVPEGGQATTEDEAVRIARRIGYPVAVKVDSPRLLHKTEADAVRLGIGTEEELRAAFRQVRDNAAAYRADLAGSPVRVERMVGRGVEVIVGARYDDVFGPLVLFGTGGIAVELFRDVAIRMAPLTVDDALAMMAEVKGSALLEGFRGRPPADREAVARILVRLSRLMAAAGGRIREIDLNPVIVLPAGQGAVCADALVIPRGKGGAAQPRSASSS